MEKCVQFSPERVMHRRNKLTDPPPKYANLKETIATLATEGPDRNLLMDATATPSTPNADGEIISTIDASSSSASTSASSSSSLSFDPSAGFAPRPMSRTTLKKIQKLEHIAARKAAEAAANGGTRPSRKQRNEMKQRMSTEEWREKQKERNLNIQQSRADKKRQATSEDISTPSTPSNEHAMLTSSSSAPAPSSADSPLPHQPTKKAKLNDANDDGQ